MTASEETAATDGNALEFPTFYPDYDDLTRLTTTEEKITWLEGRVRKALLKPLRRLQVLRRRSEVVDIHLIVVYAICGGIEALSHFYRGGKGRGHFVEFCHRYIPGFRRRDRHGRSYATLLYDNFRSSLSHGFSIEQGRLEVGGRHGHLDGRYGLEIDPWALLGELETALVTYLDEVRKDAELQASFEKRFNAVFRHWIRLSELRAQERRTREKPAS
jgi:hypothetical protein